MLAGSERQVGFFDAAWCSGLLAENSIYALLWTLLGGAGTVFGPYLRTLAMNSMVDVFSGYTSHYQLVVGVALLLLVLFFAKGVMGTLRDRLAPWLP